LENWNGTARTGRSEAMEEEKSCHLHDQMNLAHTNLLSYRLRLRYNTNVPTLLDSPETAPSSGADVPPPHCFRSSTLWRWAK
jgi:hypothetical protein